MGNNKIKTKLIDATSHSLLSGVFSNNVQYIIPDNQRLYAWDKNQFEDFYNDIKGLGDKYHFLNQITYVEEEGKVTRRYLFDGQQRTTTIMLHMMYTYSMILKSSHIEAMNLLKEYLFINKKDVSNEPRFVSASLNREIIDQMFTLLSNEIPLINGSSIIHSSLRELAKGSESNRRILDYIKYIDEAYNGDSAAQKIDRVLSDASNLVNKVELILVKIASEDEGYRIFELVNNRGRHLDNIDLIKNKIFQLAFESTNEGYGNDIKNSWGILINRYNDEIESFFRIYFSVNEYNVEGDDSRGGRALYRAFTDKLNKFDLMYEKVEYLRDLLEKMCRLDERIFRLCSNTNYLIGYSRDCIHDLAKELNVGETSFRKVITHLLYSDSFDYFKYYVFKSLCDNDLRRVDVDVDKIELIYNFYVNNIFFGTSDNTKYLKKINSQLYTILNYESDLKDYFNNFQSTNGLKFDYKSKLDSTDFKSNKTKATLFVAEKIYNDTDYTSMLFNENHVVHKMEEEHFVPQSVVNNKEPLTWLTLPENSSLKDRHERIGNKILLSKAMNLAASDHSFKPKCKVYRDTTTAHSKEFLKIICESYSGNKYSTVKAALSVLDCNENNFIISDENQLLEIFSTWQKKLAYDLEMYFKESGLC